MMPLPYSRAGNVVAKQIDRGSRDHHQAASADRDPWEGAALADGTLEKFEGGGGVGSLAHDVSFQSFAEVGRPSPLC